MFSGIVVLVAYIAVIVVMVMGVWRLYQKAGQPGWKCLIPFYNDYTLATIATSDRRIAIASVASSAGCVLFMLAGMIFGGMGIINAASSVSRGYASSYGTSAIGMGFGADFFFALAILAALCKAVVTIIVALKLAYAFDEGFATGVLLVIASPLVLPLMGFVSSIEYYGPDGEA